MGMSWGKRLFSPKTISSSPLEVPYHLGKHFPLPPCSFLLIGSSIDVPTFEADTNILLAAGKCIAFLIVQFHNTTDTQIATAFFIDKTHLLTAGHSLHKRAFTHKSVQLIGPGIPHIDATKLVQGKYPTVNCKVVWNLYSVKAPYDNDIALLHTGSFSWPDFMELSAVLPRKDATVDVIGYPGDLNWWWMKTQGDLKDIEKSLVTVEKLLPKRTLSVSRGTIETAGSLISYDLSTVPGMSGSCVVYQGKAIGISSFPKITFNEQGVHIGQPKASGGFPSAVSFTGSHAGLLFRRGGILHLINPSNTIHASFT
jgi:V8-like Glu-specific endopeptidase